MPIVRPHPAAALDGSFYFKRLATEPRFEAIVGVEVDVRLDKAFVSGFGTGTETVNATIIAKALDSSAIQAAGVVVSVSPAIANISVGSVSSPTVAGSTYTFTCQLTITKVAEGAVTEALTQASVTAEVTSATGRQGAGSEDLYYVTSRPSAPTNLVATSWPRGIRLTWTTPASQTVGDTLLNNATLAYYLIRKTTNSLTLAQAKTLIAAGSTPADGSATSDRVYAVTGNAFIDPEPTRGQTFYYWLVGVDLFGNISNLSSSASAQAGYIVDADIQQGSIDIAQAALANSVPTAMAAGTFTATKVGVLNAAFDPSTFTSNSPAAGQVSWAGLIVIINGTRYPTSPATFSGNTSAPVVIYDSSANNVVGVGSVDDLAAGDMLLGFNVSGTFRPSLTGTVIRGDTIETGTIVANKLDVNELSAIVANLGTIDAGVILDDNTDPNYVIRVDESRGLTQLEDGRPMIAAASAGGTVTITSGTATFTASQPDMKPGDLLLAGATVFTVVTGSGTTFSVTPTGTNVAAGTAFIRYRPALRVLDLAAADVSTFGPGQNNNRFISVVKKIDNFTYEDLIYITARGDAKFTGELQATSKLVVSSGSSANEPMNAMTVRMPAYFYDANLSNGAAAPSITAQTVEFLKFTTTERGLITGEGVRVAESYSTATNYAHLGTYSLTADGGTVVPVSTTATGSSAITLTTLAGTAGSYLTMVSTNNQPSGDYTIRYKLTIDLPKQVTVFQVLFGGQILYFPSEALPSQTITTVYLERSTDGGSSWSVYTQAGYTNFHTALYNTTYSNGMPMQFNYIGDAPGRSSDADSFLFTPVASSLVSGTGNVSITSGTATFQNAPSLANGDWILVNGTNYKIVSGSGTSYTVSPATNQPSSSFSVYVYEGSFTVPSTDFDPAFPPRFRVRVAGQTLYSVYSPSPTYPSVTYAIPSARLNYIYQTGAAQVTRPYSLALHGGYLYIAPQASAPESAIKGEIAMRTNASNGADPYYYNGTSWVAMGSGVAGTITVNSTTGVSALSFTGNVSVTTAAGTATINVPTLGSQLTVYEENTSLTTSASSLKFVGSSVTATSVGNDVTVTFAASGNVTSSVPAIANSVTRYDGVTGTQIKDSGVTLDDDEIFSGVSAINFTVGSPAAAERRLSWDNTEGTFNFALKGGAVELHVGQSQVQRVLNNTGSSLSKGQAVYITGAQGQRKTVALANANSEATASSTLGLVAEAIANNQEGYVQTLGYLYGLNTSSFTEGAQLWLSATTAGAITTTRPTAPNHGVRLGYCIKQHATDGIIYVDVQNGYELDELHDVLITSPQAYQFLQRNAANTAWINATQLVFGTTAYPPPASINADEITRLGGSLRVSGTVYATDFVLTGGSGSGLGLDLNDLSDVVTVSPYAPSDQQVLTFDVAAGNKWIPKTVSGGGGGGGTTVTIADDTTTNGNRYLSFVASNSGTASTLNVSSTKLTFNPSTGVLTTSGGVSSPAFTRSTTAYDSAGALTTSTTTANQVVLTLPASSYRSAKFQVQATSGSAYQVTELLVVHDGTTCYLTEYGTILTGANLASFNVDISGGNIRLLVTPVNAVTTIKAASTALTV